MILWNLEFVQSIRWLSCTGGLPLPCPVTVRSVRDDLHCSIETNEWCITWKHGSSSLQTCFQVCSALMAVSTMEEIFNLGHHTCSMIMTELMKPGLRTMVRGGKLVRTSFRSSDMFSKAYACASTVQTFQSRQALRRQVVMMSLKGVSSPQRHMWQLFASLGQHRDAQSQVATLSQANPGETTGVQVPL